MPVMWYGCVVADLRRAAREALYLEPESGFGVGVIIFDNVQKPLKSCNRLQALLPKMDRLLRGDEWRYLTRTCPPPNPNTPANGARRPRWSRSIRAPAIPTSLPRCPSIRLQLLFNHPLRNPPITITRDLEIPPELRSKPWSRGLKDATLHSPFLPEWPP